MGQFADRGGIDVVLECSGAPAAARMGLKLIKKRGRFVLSEKNVGRSSPGCSLKRDRSTLARARRGGVPVLKRPMWKPRARSSSTGKVSSWPSLMMTLTLFSLPSRTATTMKPG